MAMDDPWGSPWADEAQHDAPIISIKKEQDYIAPQTPTTPGERERGGFDPWGEVEEEVGFGEWATLPTDDGRVGGEVGPRDTNVAWGTRHSGEGKGLANGDLNGYTLPWEDSASINGEDAPRLAPSLLPEAPEISRQPSLDPWAVEDTPNGKTHMKIGTKGKPDTQPVDSHEPVVGNLHEEHGAGPALGPLASEPLEEVGSVEPESLVAVDESTKHFPIEEPVNTQQRKGDPKDVKNNKEVEVDHESSRPSSSPSDHDEILPESPRTSLDEEPKRPPIPRKVSSKVQELVQHFDTLAEAKVVEEGKPTYATSSERGSNFADTEEVDFDDDFGDFEDGTAKIGEPDAEQTMPSELPPENQAPHAKVSEVPETQASPLASPQASPQATPKASPHSSPHSSSRRATVKKDFGRVQYIADISAVGKLYPDVREETPEKVFIPDAIPYDSFSTVEQRKTWYRISRYGTAKKHNAGDDENYVRVNWAQSKVRTETLKIVARWMEEDRMSGRVVLGGGSKESSLFGWNDPNPAAVSPADAFAPKPGKKKPPTQPLAEDKPGIPREWPTGLARSLSASKTRSPPKPRHRTSSKSNRNSGELKPAPQVVASFGWNSTPDESTNQTPIPLTLKVEIPTKKTTLPPRQASAAKALALSPISSPTLLTHQVPSSHLISIASLMNPISNPTPAPAPAVPILSGQDDDWGEMVSSPINASAPVLPLSNGLRHNKSQSLTGTLPKTSHPHATDTQVPSPSSGLGHKTKASLDELLVPKTRTPPAQNTNSISMGIFDSVITGPPPKSSLPTQTAASPVPDSSVDPWASADFSFFDTPAPAAAPPPKTTPKPIPIAKSNPTKQVAFTAPPLPVAKGNGKSKTEIEQDRIVASIVKSLPDLSYMLKK